MPIATAPNPNAQTHNPNTAGGNLNTQGKPNLSKLEAIRIVLASLDNNIDAFSREGAHETAANERKKGPLFKRLVRNMWHTVMRDKVTVDNTHASREQIIKSGNLREGQGGDDKEWRADAVRRFGSDLAEHMIHEEAGETFYKFDEAAAEAAEDAEGNNHIKQMRDESLNLVREYVLGNIATTDDLKQMVEQMVEGWREKKIGEQYIQGGIFLAHNIIDMGEQTKAALDARQGLSDVDRQFLLDQALRDSEFVVGEAKVGSRAEMKETASERLAEKMRNSKWMPSSSEGTMSKIGMVLANEAVLSAMMSVGTFVAQRGVASLASKLVPGLGAGIVAGFRERRALKDERALLHRRLDNGETIDTDIKAQAELEATLYESRSAGELLAELAKLYDSNGNFLVNDKASFDAALQLQGEIRARIQIGDREGARLINYADISANEMEGRRFDLDLAMAKLEVDLEKSFNDPALAIKGSETFEDLLKAECSTMTGLLEGEMKKKDLLFNKLLLKRAFRRAVLVASGSAAVTEALRHLYDLFADSGLSETIDMKLAGDETANGDLGEASSNETAAASDLGGVVTGPAPDVPSFVTGEASPVPDHVAGAPSEVPDYVAGRASNVPDHVTGAASDVPPAVTGEATPVPDHVTGRATEVPDHVAGSSSEVPDHVAGNQSEIKDPVTGETFESDTIMLGDKTKVVLPEGYRVESAGGLVKITTPEGVSYTAKLENGMLSNDGLEALKDKGFNVLYREDPIEGEPEVHNEKVSAREFAENHKDEMVRIKNESWYHNNTKSYDLNELGLHNEQLDSGNIRISVKGMTAGGSFNGDSSVDWQEAAKDGHLKLYLSASQGTQTRAFEIPIDADGEIEIDKDSPAGRLFDKNGKFIGGYQQVSIKGGTTPDGRIKIATLATVVGEKNSDINDVMETPTTAKAHTYTIVPPIENMASTATLVEDEAATPYFGVSGRRRLGGSGGPAVVAPNVTPSVANNPGGGTAPNTGGGAPNTSAQAPNNQQAGPNGQTAPGPNSATANPNNATGPNTTNPNTANSQGSGANPNNAAGQNGVPNPNSSATNPNAATGSGSNAGPNSGNSGSKPNNTGGPTGANGQPNGQPGNPNNSASGGPNSANNPNGSPSAKKKKNANNTNGGNAGATGNTGAAGGGAPNGQGSPNGGSGQQTGGQTGGQTGPNKKKGSGPTYNFTSAERATARRIGNDPRTMPPEFANLDFSTVPNGLAQKLIVITLHNLIGASQRSPNESYAEWRMRVVQGANAYARQALASLGSVSPGLRPIVMEAFQGLQYATTPASANGSANSGGTGTTTGTATP